MLDCGFKFFVVLLFSTALCVTRINCQSSSTSPWTWNCVNEECVRTKLESGGTSQSLDVCRITCGTYGSLWPRPVGLVKLGKVITPFDPETILIGNITAPTDEVLSLIDKAVDIFKKNIRTEIPRTRRHKGLHSFRDFNEVTVNVPFAEYPTLELTLTVNQDDVWVVTGTDESYQMNVSLVNDVIKVFITSEEYFGLRHALETLSQLVAYDSRIDSLVLASNVSIWDRPSFVHRAIMLDTARNYYSLESIKRTLDGMSYNKLNVFHWHITDSQSFPFVSTRVPQMSQWGSYSPEKVYTPEDILDVVDYARVRGIKVMPEIDEPSHAGNGWQWGEDEGLGKLALCVNSDPYTQYCSEPPCGQLNPVNNNTLTLLGEIYRDMADVFHTDVYPMGGDEVNLGCWKSSEEVTSWLEEHGRNVTDQELIILWSDFQVKALQKLREAVGQTEFSVMLWSSDLTKPDSIQQYLDRETYIVQYWGDTRSPEVYDLVKQNYRVIISNNDAWYLDCGFGDFTSPGNSWCDPYKQWRTMYDNDPIALATSGDDQVDTSLVLGGEVCLWSEEVDDQSVDSRLWPRSAAAAERLWSNPAEDWRAAETRMLHQRERLVKRGIAADPLQPEYCHQNEGKCINPIF